MCDVQLGNNSLIARWLPSVTTQRLFCVDSVLCGRRSL